MTIKSKPRKTNVSEAGLPEMILSSVYWPMLFLGAATVIAGTAAASLRGNMELLPASLCLIFTLMAQVAGTFWYMYNQANRSGDDVEVDRRYSRISRPAVYRETVTSVSIMGSIIGLALLTMAGWWGVVPAVLLLVVVYFTFGGAHPLSRSPWGIISTLLLFGPIGVFCTCLIQSGHEAYSLLNFYDVEPAIYISVIMAMMAFNANLVHNVDNLSADRAMGNVTFPMRCGMGATRVAAVVSSLIWVAACWRLFSVQHVQSMLLVMIYPAVSFIVNLVVVVRMSKSRGSASTSLQLVANLNMLAMAVDLLIIAFLQGATDDSAMNFI